NEQRKKLSKRRDKVALEQFRDEGFLPEAMVNYLMTLGWSPPGDSEIVPWEQIEREFSLEDVTHAPAFFDLKKLSAFNGEYIRALSVDEFVRRCEPWLPDHWDRERFAAVAPLSETRIVTLSEAPGIVDFMFTDDPEIDEASWKKVMTTDVARPIVSETIDAYGSCEWLADALKEALEAIGAGHGLKLGKAQAPVRVA